MAWSEPKTDWERGGKVNWQDYERIRQNVEFLIELGGRLHGSFVTAKMWSIDETVIAYPEYTEYESGDVTNKMRYAAPCFVDYTFDPIERNLEAIGENTYRPPGFPATKTWVGGQKLPGAADMNRIESSCQMLYLPLIREEEALRKLPFNMVHVPTEDLTWVEWDALGGTWEQIDARNRTAADYFKRD